MKPQGMPDIQSHGAEQCWLLRQHYLQGTENDSLCECHWSLAYDNMIFKHFLDHQLAYWIWHIGYVIFHNKITIAPDKEEYCMDQILLSFGLEKILSSIALGPNIKVPEPP